ncbi:MAG TPA: hypothetical protein VN743_05185 [Blastocatellia bacterium]|nr:hypothetical protein [Blastocatellia bacterium]
MYRHFAVVSLVLLALAGAGCSLLSHEAPTEDADKAAGLFFQRLNNNEYDKIYDDAAKRFRTNKPRQVVTDSLKELTANGKVRDFERISMPIQGEGKDRMVLPVYKTLFESVSGDIYLTFLDEGGEWKLFGFAFKPKRS